MESRVLTVLDKLSGRLGCPPLADGAAGWLGLAIAVAVVGAWMAISFLRDRSGMPFNLWFWRNATDLVCRSIYRFRRIGPCTVPSQGSVIIVANHTCSLDPLFITAGIPDRVPAWMIAREFYGVPLFGRLVKMVECIPVRRDGQDAAATKAALRHLKSGKLLGIFIEGRIGRPGEQLPPKDGAAMLAIRSGATVVPAHISGTRYAPTVLGAYFRAHRARVRFGEPIRLADYCEGKPTRRELSHLSDILVERIHALRPSS